jgi:hypothetical protein
VRPVAEGQGAVGEPGLGVFSIDYGAGDEMLGFQVAEGVVGNEQVLIFEQFAEERYGGEVVPGFDAAD